MRGQLTVVPVIINNRDLAAWPRAMVQNLRRMKHCGPIVIVDNASTNPATTAWYNELDNDTNAVVIYLRYNGGHKAPWSCNVPWSLRQQFGYTKYIVTDPDLDLSECPDTTLEYLLDIQANMGDTLYSCPVTNNPYNMLDKIGLGMQIDDIPDGAVFTNGIKIEEAYYERNKPAMPNYKNLKGPPVMPAPVDTTLALYDVHRVQTWGIGGCRTLEIKARHLPYYVTAETLRDETPAMQDLHHYLQRANESSTAKGIYDALTNQS